MKHGYNMEATLRLIQKQLPRGDRTYSGAKVAFWRERYALEDGETTLDAILAKYKLDPEVSAKTFEVPLPRFEET